MSVSLPRLPHDLDDARRPGFLNPNTRTGVVPNDMSPEGVIDLGTIRGARTQLVQRPRLADLVRSRPSGLAFGGTDLFEVRTRIQGTARFV
ncbi:MAG: hypothetical protein WBL06_08755 [Pseudolysinimonas sp.]|uniref:hypothetical protein n=1 Tax=Pseudolysinimonas sp. TaxID=2680009 RepID=UPI003C710084